MTDKPALKQMHKRIDELEATIVDNLKLIDVPVKHLFTKGMYIREVRIPKGSIVTSKIHKTEHPFTISKGKVRVMIDGVWEELCAPYTGITPKNTRRVVMVMKDVVWTTYHKYPSITGKENSLPLEKQDEIADKIENRIIQTHKNALINRRDELWHG